MLCPAGYITRWNPRPSSSEPVSRRKPLNKNLSVQPACLSFYCMHYVCPFMYIYHSHSVCFHHSFQSFLSSCIFFSLPCIFFKHFSNSFKKIYAFLLFIFYLTYIFKSILHLSSILFRYFISFLFFCII